MSIQHDHTLNPVTALEFYDDSGRLLILAGEGCFLKVIEAESSNLICQCRIFEAQAIHGLALSEKSGPENDLQLVVWGGTSLTLLSQQTVHSLLSQALISVTELEVTTADWILDVAVSPSSQGCVLLTAHNTILKAAITGGCKSVSFESLPSPSRSILYSAHLLYESSTRILVAAGTVFGEIIVWECTLSQTGTIPESKVLCTLVGHEGSIFGVNISPEVTDRSGAKTRLLASCSDDRTIRIWDIFDLARVCADVQDENSTSLAAVAPLPRETGFGDNDENGNSRSTSAYMAMAMGHASRIWGVRFYQPKAASTRCHSAINLLSFGEDATAQRWILSSWKAYQKSSEQVSTQSDNFQGSLLHAETLAYHRGKHIFSAAIFEGDESQFLLASGGSDGRIPIYHIDGEGSAESDGCKTSHGNVSVTELGVISQSVADSKQGRASEEFQKPGGWTYLSSTWDLDIAEMPLVSERASPNTASQLSVFEAAPDLENDAKVTQDRPETGETDPEVTKPNKTSKKQKMRKIPKDAWNRYAFVAEDKLLVTTTFGRILLCDLDLWPKWKHITTRKEEQQALKSYTVMKGIAELGIAFLAGTNGVVYVYNSTLQDQQDVNGNATHMVASELTEFGKVDGKVADMFPIIQQDRSISLLVTTVGNSMAIIFSSSVRDASRIEVAQTTTLKLPDMFVVTSAAEIGDLTILGGRRGSLAVYSCQEGSRHLALAGKDGTSDAITSIIQLRGSKTNFLTTSRDGSFSIFTVSGHESQSVEQSSLSISCVHQGSPPFGPMIEAAWFKEGDLFLYGFRSKNFVVWNETKQCEVATIDCGGAHRSYAYSPLRGINSGGHFAYTKASKLYIQSSKKASHKVLKQGGHGREIKACAVSPDQSLFATGAEDTVIRIWKYNDQDVPLKHEFESLNIMKKHTTGIQKLLWHETRYLFSSGGNEEFFVWAVTSIEGFGVGVSCEAKCPERTEDGDLRITSFDVTELPSSSGDSMEQPLLVSLAYSDSTIRSYRYTKESGFELLATGRYTSSCLTQLQHLIVSDKAMCLITAATDGSLAIWRSDFNMDGFTCTPIPLLLQSVHKVHQNSIKSFDILRHGKNGSIIIATGGDDNALGLTIYNEKTFMTGAAPCRTILRSAHAAAVTGLAFVPGRDLRIVTSSNDQRVREWSIALDAAEQVAVIKKVGDVFTSIADVGDLSVLRGGNDGTGQKKVVVVGNGMDVWRVGQEPLM